MRSATILTAIVVFALVMAVRAADQATGARPGTSPARQALPPLVQTCPMHPDVIEDRPGTCPLCRMALVPVRLESVWSCPLHAAVVRDTKGTCPICGRELVQMTMALTWTCKGRPDIDVLEPGRCPDGSAMVAKRTLRPHGNHNPQHGGQFFMAPDNTHHLEGTLPSTRLFRVYLYDEYARPLPLARAKQVSGTIEAAGRTIPLVAVSQGSYLEGRVETARFPAQMTARLRITPTTPEYRFDFAFSSVTSDPNVSRSAARSASANRPPASTRAATEAGTTSAGQPVDPALIQVPIPTTVTEIVAQLRTRDAQVLELIDRGNLPAVFVPAFQARDLAIALEDHLSTLTEPRRDQAQSAISTLVRAAWLLDSSGDIGNREQAMAAYELMHGAARTLTSAFGSVR